MTAPEPDAQASVLLVDTGQAVETPLADTLASRTTLDVTTTSDLATARTRLASTSVGCLVVNLDPLDDDGRAFVSDARTIAPDCPVVAFTTHGPETLAADLLAQVTTLVERSDGADNWEFLVEKIQRSLRPPTPTRDLDEQYRLLVESARDGLYQLDASGNLVYTNEAFAEMLGYSRGDLLGSHASRVTADGELGRGQQLIQQLLDSDARESDVIENELLTSDGERITLAINFVILTTDDGSYDGLIGVARDVTERKRYQQRLEELTEQLEVLNRVVRHDIRSDIGIILGWAELLKSHTDESGREYLERIADSGRRIVELTDVTREYIEALTGGDDLTVTPTALRPVLETELELRRESFPDAEFVVDGDIPAVDVAANEMLSSVLRNLLNNAVQHNDKETPRVTVSCEVEAEAVDLRIADNGPGIPDDRKEAVFGKGETSMDSAESGIGLYLVQTLVDQYDGAVRVEDNAPEGSVFRLRLNRAD